MKLVLDSNVFISAFFWGGNPRKVMERIINGDDLLFVSDEILREVSSVMARPKFNAGPRHAARFIAAIAEVARRVPYLGKVRGGCRDGDDDKVLECAVLGAADFIITGDNDLLSLESFEGIPIITAAEYAAKFNNGATP